MISNLEEAGRRSGRGSRALARAAGPALEDEFLTTAGVMARWRLSESALRRHVRDGTLRPLRRRGRLLWPWDEVLRHEEGGTPGQGVAVDAAPLLTVGEAARLTGYSVSHLYALAADGAVPAVRVLGRLRFSEAVLRAWLRGGEGGDADPDRMNGIGPDDRHGARK